MRIGVGYDVHPFVPGRPLVLGGVTIGDDCIVGAHAVLTEDMPDGSLALGVPAKVYPNKGRDAILSWMS